jgi:hypothetical protein
MNISSVTSNGNMQLVSSTGNNNRSIFFGSQLLAEKEIIIEQVFSLELCIGLCMVCIIIIIIIIIIIVIVI